MIELQRASHSIWDSKHRLKTFDNTPIDNTVEDMFMRVALALAAVEEKDNNYWTEQFYDAMVAGAYPAGRILSNANAIQYKPETTLINCVVSSNIKDSLASILDIAKENAITLKSGAGIGFCFSNIRPRGAFVNGVNASTSGPLSFADIYDKVCFTIRSAGGRRGSMMLTFHVYHPDIFDVIKAKKEDGRLRQFNISILITEEFVNAVKQDADWDLYFPIHNNANESCTPIWKKWHVEDENHIKNDEGLTACKVYKTVKAKDIWNAVMESNYNFAEPGFILIDRINFENNLYFCEEILALNPCGEQALPPGGSCLLGSINLAKLVENPFTDTPYFNFDKFNKLIPVFSRMLDNVVEIANLPIQSQMNELIRKRRHGMGFLGLGSALNMLKIRYGSPESVDFSSRVSRLMAITGFETGIQLAQEKGPAPIMNEKFALTKHIISRSAALTRLYNEGEIDIGQELDGKTLISYSNYFQRLPDKLISGIREHGSRYTHATSIAPTGTLALGIGNNCCVAKGSIIKTINGNIAIENVDSTKDKILTYIPSKETFEYREIEFCGVTRPNANVLEITLEDDTTLKVTPDHKILVNNTTTNQLKYVEAQFILREDKIVSPELKNNSLKIKSIKPSLEKIDTYDIQVKTNIDEERNFVANNIVVHNSNGGEPTFGHEAIRNIIITGKKTKEAVPVYSYEALRYKHEFGMDAELPDYFVTTDDLSPMDHIRVQAAIQPFIDSSISKCVAKGTRILTTNGYVKIEDFSDNRTEDTFKDISDKQYKILCSDKTVNLATDHYYNGLSETVTIEFDNGIKTQVSNNHKFLSFTDDGIIKWAKSSDLNVSDKVLVKVAKEIEFENPIDIDKNQLQVIGLLNNFKNSLTNNLLKLNHKSQNNDDFIKQINSLNKELNLESNVVANNRTVLISLESSQYIFLKKLKNSINEFIESKILHASIEDRKEFISLIKNKDIVLNDQVLITANARTYETAQLISEIMYSLGHNNVISQEGDFDFKIIEISDLLIDEISIQSRYIPIRILNIKKGTSELYDITVKNSHEYIVSSGIVSHNTINCPTNIPFKDFQQVYFDAVDNGLKSCTTYRFNPEAFQGVIVRNEDLENTQYRITLEDGTELIAKGNDMVNYDDNETTVANLFDAIKEGQYGKF